MSSRLQKKCFVASAAVHGLALAMFVVGSAFFTPKNNEPMPAMMDLIPLDQIKFTDDPVPPPPVPIAKGEPEAKVERTELETKPPEPVKQPDPEPPKVEPKKEEPKKEEPVKREEPAKKIDPPKQTKVKAELPPKKENNVEDSAERLKRALASMETKKTEPPKPKREIKVSFEKADTSKVQQEREAAAKKEAARRAEKEKQEREYQAQVAAANEAARKAQQARAAAVRGVVEGIEGGLSSGTAIEMPGPNAFAFANYGVFVQKKFKDAWTPPNEANAATTCRVEVKIARDGKVISARILNKSNDATMDRTVQKALDRVKQLPPFPEGAKDTERTFLINFNINPTRQIG
jgi:colicin import membrane protein